MTLIYNFFELIGDMIRNKIPLVKMFTYLFFLTPKLIMTRCDQHSGGRAGGFRVLSKQNEVTAFKACGVSLHRLALPVFIGTRCFARAVPVRLLLLPGANRRQDALRDESRAAPRKPICVPTASGSWATDRASTTIATSIRRKR